MAIAKRGSRRIVVDSVAYRWKVLHTRNDCPCCACADLEFLVWCERTYATLAVSTGTSRPNSYSSREMGIVTPANVASAVRLAIRDGWEPNQSRSHNWLLCG